MASQTFGRILLKTLGVLAFCAVSGYALFLAFGYNLDLQNRHIEKTSIIDVPGRYSEAMVYLDGKIIGNSLPLQIKDLVPGFYDLSISKLDYLPWSRNLQVHTDIVTKVDDVVLVPKNTEKLVQQLVHFPEKSRYFYGEDFFVVLTEGHDYLTLVYLLKEGTMKEEELKLSRQDVQDVRIYSSQKFLVTFSDNSYEWVEFNGPRFVDFQLPKGASELTFLPSRNAAYFLYDRRLYRVDIEQLPALDVKSLDEHLVATDVDQFDVHDDRLVYLSGGLAYSANDTGKNIRLIDRSHKLVYLRYVPLSGSSVGLYVVRNVENGRLLYAVDERGISTLLTPKLKGEVYQDGSQRALFADESGNIFLYRPVLRKKLLVTTLPTDFSLLGLLFGDGHFAFGRQNRVFIADSTFTNVYPLFDFQEKSRYFLQHGSIFSLEGHKLKSLFFLPKN